MVAELTKTNGTYTGFKGVDTVGAHDYGYGGVYLTENKTTTSGGRWGRRPPPRRAWLPTT